MLGYATVGTNDIEKSRGFYDPLLAEFGAKRLMAFDNGFTMYGTGYDAPMLAVTPPYDGKAATVGNGTMIALVAGSRPQVDAIYAKARALGGADEGEPGIRGEEGPQAFYGAYFRDPDGNKLCVFRIGGAA